MDKIFTKEEIEYINNSDILTHLYTIKYAQYKRNTTRSVNDAVADLYDKYHSTPINRKNFGCSVCVYNMYKFVSDIYYNSVDYYNSIEVRTQPISNNNESEEVVTNKETKTKKITKTTNGKSKRAKDNNNRLYRKGATKG